LEKSFLNGRVNQRHPHVDKKLALFLRTWLHLLDSSEEKVEIDRILGKYTSILLQILGASPIAFCPVGQADEENDRWHVQWPEAGPRSFCESKLAAVTTFFVIAVFRKEWFTRQMPATRSTHARRSRVTL
jgi:hypothetical protein